MKQDFHGEHVLGGGGGQGLGNAPQGKFRKMHSNINSSVFLANYNYFVCYIFSLAIVTSDMTSYLGGGGEREFYLEGGGWGNPEQPPPLYETLTRTKISSCV